MKEDDPVSLEAYRGETFFRRGAGIATIINLLQGHGLQRDLTDLQVVEFGLGEGSGRYVLELLGAKVTTVDPKDYPGELSYNKESPLNYLRKLPDQTLDAVFSFDTDSKLWSVNILKETRRLLKPNGRVVLSWRSINRESREGVSWPIGWPYWSSRNLFNEHLAHFENGRFVSNLREFADPQQLKNGLIQISPKIPFEQVILPEVMAVVCHNY